MSNSDKSWVPGPDAREAYLSGSGQGRNFDRLSCFRQQHIPGNFWPSPPQEAGMSTSPELKRCPKCGTPIPAEAPQGLCPKCLLSEISIPTEAGAGAHPKSPPPTVQELAAAFPQLEILEFIGQGG